MSHVAAGAFCPFVTAASPEMFGFDEFTELSKPRDLEKSLSPKNTLNGAASVTVKTPVLSLW